MPQKGSYIGAGAGLILFALIGLLPGSFIGGAIGVNIATKIFGTPLEASLLPKIIIALAMVSGTFIAGLVFIVGSSLTGWMLGRLIETTYCSKVVNVTKRLW